MRAVLSVASECAPLVKTGGLADVAGALPAAMAGQGWRMRTLIPGYPSVMAQLDNASVHWEAAELFGGPARLWGGRVAGLDLIVLDAPHLYDRDGSIYLSTQGADWPDNPERFAALCWVAAMIARDGLLDWRPELVHCHDWQAALTPTYLKSQGTAVPSLLTIHNVAFHGLAGPDRLFALRLPADRFNPDGFEFYGQISALKAGLMDADAISTVSPTYARELMTPDFGMGLDGVLRMRAGDLHGILNGIDLDIWSPATDPAIAQFSTPRGKARARAGLLAEFGIEDGGGPLAIVVSRLTGQKGLDLLLEAAPRFLAQGGSLAVLGSGERWLEDRFRLLAEREPRVGTRIGYDEPLSHRMFAGADAVLVPSRFEPCGLTQMYGLRYGAVPLVARTGGLADTVIDANEAALRAGVATGIVVTPGDPGALAQGLERLCTLHADPVAWSRIQRNAMRHPVGWEDSAARYAQLYAALAG
ncbi:glycogen synthase GlgA [Halovulum dunhuangense]|uniref:Glycogen synthase n=1 Tax=Halovulum dunhuangense TaxID=1505036 RepID=A0A849L3L6_9RHOB|nr:glycogen synthase GlgA [Halovulum dunhuangense]NNU80988.1 glycogen synthase GlgA [Halovulum dunhuangense]